VEPVRTNLAPWIPVSDAGAAAAFYAEAFGAEELYRLEDEPGHLAVARLAVDGADFWIQDSPASAGVAGAEPIRMILTVADPDGLYARATAAGASEVAPVEEAHGWRVGRLADPFGHHWEIGRPVT
jgi:PhnB protein